MTVTAPGHPVLGWIPDLRRDPLDAMERLARFGDVVRFRIGPLPAFTVNDPEAAHHVLVSGRDAYVKSPIFQRLSILLGDGLVMTTGAEWKWDRRQVQPSFTKKHIDGRLDAMARIADGWIERFRAESGVDFASEMLGLSMSLLVGTLMPQVDADSLDRMREAFEVAQDELATRLWDVVPTPLAVPTRRNRRFLEARRVLVAELERATARAEGGPDLVSTIVAASPFPEQRARPEDKVQDQLLTFLFAGHETTSNSLAFLGYHLARDAAVQAELRDELRGALGDGPLTLAALPALPKTRAAIEEALRIHPTIWAYTRHAARDDRIGDVFVPRGATVLVSPWTLHRHPEHWTDPERYDPRRFEGPWRRRPAFIPFGAGARACIGDRFAMLEMTAVVAALLRRFELGLPQGYTLRPRARLTVGLEGGLPMTLRRL